MSTIRTEKTENYSILSNGFINDPALSYAEVGLLTFLLSKPNNWKVNVQNLVNSHTNGKDAVYAVLKSLGEKGYIEREQEQGEGGKFSQISYVVREEPVGKTASGKTGYGSTGYGKAGRLLITDDDQRLNRVMTDSIASAKSADSPRPLPSNNPASRQAPISKDHLDALIAAYPRHRVPGSDDAWDELIALWNGLVRSKNFPYQAVIEDILRRKKGYDWTKDGGRYVQGIIKYLRDRVWEQPILPEPGLKAMEDPHRGMTRLSEHVYIFGPPPGTE